MDKALADAQGLMQMYQVGFKNGYNALSPKKRTYKELRYKAYKSFMDTFQINTNGGKQNGNRKEAKLR